MRKASFAKLSLTALVGLGSLVARTELASAGPAPQGGSIVVAPTTTPSTIKPIVAEPVDHCDTHLCLDAAPADPTPDPPADKAPPIAAPDDDCDQPSCDKAPVPQDHDPTGCSPMAPFCDEVTDADPGCNVTHGCPDETPCSEEDHARTSCDGDETPCSEEDQARTNCDPGDDPCREHCDEGGTTGGTDGETTTTDGGGGGGRLPHTGADVASMAAIGLGLTGVGAAAKRLGRRK